MSQRFYSEEEAEAILKLASRKSTDGSMSRESLISTASELGISVEAVEEAEKTYRLEKQETDDRLAYAKSKRSEFTSAMVGYLGTCGGLAVLNLFLEHHLTWVYWVFFGLGFGVFGTFREAFLLTGEEREKSFRRWQRRRDRRARIAAGIQDPGDLEEEEREDADHARHHGREMRRELRSRR